MSARPEALRVIKSNRVERLVDALADRLRSPPCDAQGAPDPFCTEQIVIHSRGMGSWLSAKLSEQLGVCANVDFVFPKRLIQNAFHAALGDGASEGDAWQPERLVWSTLVALPTLLDEPALAPLRGYLADDLALETRKSHRLVRRIADLFDRYTTYRADLVRGWTAGAADDWQALLWRALRERIPSRNLADLAQTFLERAAHDAIDVSRLPRRVALFCISMLPPLYVQVLAALARHIEIDLYLLCPSREYWGDIASRREQLRLRAAARGGTPLELLHLDEGHPVLASLGRLGRDFQVTLELTADYHEPDLDLFEDPVDPAGEADATLLRALQQDLLDLRGPAAEGARPLAADDASVEIHSCHGPMRQVEVLKDRILDLFQTLPELQARDVVVMTPDIDTYAPLIEAAFSHDQHDPRHLPYRIADRSLRRESPLAEAFLRLLDLAGARVTATEVFDILSLPCIRDRFGIDTEDLDRIADWVRDSGIRWGIDAAHRHEHDQPARAENTWRFGLDRLLLGFAMQSDGHTLFGGTLPFAAIDGADGPLLGRFCALTDALFAAIRTLLAGPRPLAQWRDAGRQILAELFSDDDASAWERDHLLGALGELTEQSEQAGFEADIRLEVLKDLLVQRLEQVEGSASFFAGGVTVCAMVPMRTVPFRVVCLLGLDETAFPRREPRLDFDQMIARPRIGDRTRRDEDRYLVLEAILSARDRLLITYTGRSLQTNEPLPPSVVVSELLDLFEECYTPAPGFESVTAQLVLEHPLQSFSPRNFGADDDPRRFSYARELVDGALALQHPVTGRRPFLERPLRADDDATTIALDDLIAFFTQPGKALLRRRLGLSLFEEERAFADREPLALDPLERWAIHSRVIELQSAGVAESAILPALAAQGDLPPGTIGAVVCDEARERVADYVAELRAAVASLLPPQPVRLRCGEFTIIGRLDQVLGQAGRPVGVLFHRYSTLKGKYLLPAWIQHLVAQLCWPGTIRESRILTNQKDVAAVITRLRRAAEPEALLGLLLRLYRFGQSQPLLLFPNTSYQYAQTLVGKGASRANADKQAAAQWRGNDMMPGEGADAYLKLLYGDEEPCQPHYRWPDPPTPDDLTFAPLAEQVFGPILAHLESDA